MDPGSLDSMWKNFNEFFPPEDNNESGDSDVEIYNFKMDDDDSDDSTISCSLLIEDKKLAQDVKKIVTDIDDQNHSLSENHSEDEESDIKVYTNSVKAFQKHWLDIQLVWEDTMHQCTVNGKNLPTSYTNLTSMEKLVLLHASNFIQQFEVKYPNRRQMALVFENECGIQKCVCTAIKPSRLDYPNLNDLSSYSEFVANHITYTKLEDPTILPKKMMSPTATLEMQTANCLEFATLLESFLIGTGYNAFIVQGYATESVCNNDLTKVKLDLPKDSFKDDQSESDSDSFEEFISKRQAEIDYYTPEPMIDLSNAYVNLLLEEEKNENVVQNKVKEEDNLNNNADSLFGKRVHCWVMLLPPEINDSNTIEVPYFIEPSTGERKDINDQNYIGIEAIWNHKNYWVNLQSSNGGCKDYDFTIMNTNCWEHFLPDNGQIHPYMPISWVNNLEVPYNKYVMLYPTGKKIMHYMNALQEFFAEYIMPDGLIQRTTYYAEPEYKSKIFVQEVYKHRSDSLIGIEITINKTTKGTETVEYFRSGRKDCLKLHKFCGDSDRMDTDRLVTFYKSRFDSLIELMVYEKNIIETTFEDRPDFLFWRTCVLEDFSSNISIFNTTRKPTNIIEKYLRDESKPKDRDIYTIQFDYTTDDVYVKYQYGEGQITQSSRLFKYSVTTFDNFNPAESVIENIVYPYTDNLKPHEAYLMSKEMLEAKNEAFRVVLKLQDNIIEMLEIRSRERLNFKLTIDSLDWDRNYKMRQILQNKKDLLIALAKREKSKQISDYTLPYFLTTKTITYDFALNVRNKIMKDFRRITNTKFKRIQNAFNNKKHKFKSLTKALAESEKFNDVKIKHKALIMCATLKSELDVLMLKITRYKETRIQRYNNLASNLNSNENFITLPPLKLYSDI